MSSVNSKSSHNVARERARLNIKIAARSGLVFILFVLCRTWITLSPVKPRTKDAVNVIKMSHHMNP